MRVHKRNSSLACQAIALKDSHLSLVTSGHFLILPSAFFLSVPTIVGWLLKQLVRILPGPVTERLINRFTERISKAANALCLKVIRPS